MAGSAGKTSAMVSSWKGPAAECQQTDELNGPAANR
jgi:hypothetical protein